MLKSKPIIDVRVKNIINSLIDITGKYAYIVDACTSVPSNKVQRLNHRFQKVLDNIDKLGIL